ncbi:hypothetical protein MOC12_16235, partial [Bacillus spizizenii]|nr:hypothetical protein [Bacillus spizizenii]
VCRKNLPLARINIVCCSVGLLLFLIFAAERGRPRIAASLYYMLATVLPSVANQQRLLIIILSG